MRYDELENLKYTKMSGFERFNLIHKQGLYFMIKKIIIISDEKSNKWLSQDFKKYYVYIEN